jgi:formylglycine-generating enzyme required for sulfatase activity
MLERVHARGVALRESGLELMRRAQPERALDADGAIASGDAPPTASISFWLTLASTDLEQASALLPEDRELAELVSKFRAGAQLSVTSDVDGALVRIDSIGALDGRRIRGSELGRTPLRDVDIAPGCYRITVDAGELGFAEMTRTIDRPNTRLDLHARIASTSAVTSDMVAIAGGPFVFGDPTNTNVFKQREAWVDAFWIDATEVSNAQYRAFVLDTGHALPALWLDRDGRDIYRSEWGELPIAGVRQSDARAYAEWAGKRLPTQFEWERAARGIAGRRFAWGDDGGEVLLRTDLGRPKCWDAADFFRDASPVGSHANGCSPEGVFHLFDNVREWTESPYSKLVQGVVEVQSGTFLVMGGDWGSDPATWDLRYRASSYFDNYEFALGFRCAKSGAP